MKLVDIVKQIKNEKPELLGKLPEKRAVALLRESFAHLAKSLDEQEEVVKVPGLGSFRTRSVEKEKGGQKTTSKRIIFRPAGSARKGAGKGAAKPGNK